MMDIQRWTHDGIYMTTQPDGRYVEYADHLADRAELVRLLKEYHRQHLFTARKNYCKRCECAACKGVDALEGMK
jgi:hypothetical protein